MASTKLMASSTSRNSDLRRRSSSSSSTKSSLISDLHMNEANQNHRHQTPAIGDNSTTLNDGQLRNAYGENQQLGSTFVDAEINLLDAAGAIAAIGDNEVNRGGAPLIRRQESVSTSRTRTVDDVWKEIVAGKSVRKELKQEAPEEMMTLEDFLAKAGAVEEEDKKTVPLLGTLSCGRLSGGVFPYDHQIPTGSFQMQALDGTIGFANGVEVMEGSGKRRALMEPLDKAAQQRQRRMIKNRESAARSRERKQAYQIELESLVVKLEEEQEELLKEKAERTKQRRKQLMEKIIPVTEERRPKRILRRAQSNEW